MKILLFKYFITPFLFRKNLPNCRSFSTFIFSKKSQSITKRDSFTQLFFFFKKSDLFFFFNLSPFYFFKFFFKLNKNLKISDLQLTNFSSFFLDKSSIFPPRNSQNLNFLFFNFSNFLAKFLFWQYRNRIFFLNRQFLVNLKYYFLGSSDREVSFNFKNNLFFFKNFINFFNSNNSTNYAYYLKISNLYIKSSEDVNNTLHFKFFDFFKNPYSFKIPPFNKRINFFKNLDIISENVANSNYNLLKSFFVKYKHLQWPIISDNYKGNHINRRKKKYHLRFLKKLKYYFENINPRTVTSSIAWLMSHYLNFNICIMSMTRGALFFAITTARGYILLRRSQTQFCPISKSKLYKEHTFPNRIAEKFSHLCSMLKFFGLVYFLKNGFEDSRMLTIFKLMASKTKFKVNLRGIIIGRSLPHGLPGRMRKKRRQ